MNKTKLTESEKLERKLMRMFEKQFVNYKLKFETEEAHIYDLKNKYIGKSLYYTDTETYLVFIAYRAGYLKGKLKL